MTNKKKLAVIYGGKSGEHEISLLSAYSVINALDSDKYDIKLTLLMNISQKPYEGGEFRYFHYEETTAKQFIKPGNVILIKSDIHHKVTPVTKGERTTLTHFISGPKFR